MTDMLVHLDGAVEETLKRLVEAGFFKTKSEAVRAGILALGRDYRVVKSREELLGELAVEKMRKIDKEIAAGRQRAYTEREMMKEFGL